ncbi:MAG: D-lactate dehydrogenase [Devosia sp.]|uniref:D-lactate dehydrogenase n=1 Tax=Devosia sp. TaxID=1871048 RepID=UPI0024CC95B2|nr:D-lactate dehydrogenase [Devosia sp.]UYN99128.1 MAG: D-lactate dehydrogenase [Devosia sp.]
MSLLKDLRDVVGVRHVLTGDGPTRRYRKGFRVGGGAVIAVVRPGTLVEQWKVLELAVAADVIIIMQAANTGLTGGSTPFGSYDRPVLIVNAMRIKRLDLLGEGSEVVCLPGVTLDELEKSLRQIGREPHSVIGSSCIGASVTGGVCNNSGGSLIQRGPAYTQFAVFARVDAEGRLQLVNHLGIELGDNPEDILGRLDRGEYGPAEVQPQGNQWASDREYQAHLRDVAAETPARYNADPRRHYEASGSAGKLAVFALRLDTFAADGETRSFYVGSNDVRELETIRQRILTEFAVLPISGEYLDKAFHDLTRRHGKDLFLLIKHFGTDNVPRAFAWKSRFDGFTDRLGLGSTISDRVIQALVDLLPNHLPKRIETFGRQFQHHLVLRCGERSIAETRALLSAIFPSANGDFFECDAREAEAAYLHRFAAGAASIRYAALNRRTVEGLLGLDVAFPRNDIDVVSQLPPDLAAKIAVTAVCGHFFCHVMHNDYLVAKGHDVTALKDEILHHLRLRGAKYPAEHNVGHQYEAGPEQAAFFRELDPTNAFNPGIGKTPRGKHWQDDGAHCGHRH